MGTLKRDDIIDELLHKICRDIHPSEVFGYKKAVNSPEFDVARETLNSYPTDLLIELHMHGTSTSEDGPRPYYMSAYHGETEAQVRTYMFLTEQAWYLFKGEDSYYACTSDTATKSLISLYPSLQFENTPDYYRKALALTGVVTTIQSRLNETEGQYRNKGARLLKYSPDPSGEYSIDKLVRIKNEKLTELILNRPDEWENIADVVVERKTDDVETIKAILNGEAPLPVMKGVL